MWRMKAVRSSTRRGAIWRPELTVLGITVLVHRCGFFGLMARQGHLVSVRQDRCADITPGCCMIVRSCVVLGAGCWVRGEVRRRLSRAGRPHGRHVPTSPSESGFDDCPQTLTLTMDMLGAHQPLRPYVCHCPFLDIHTSKRSLRCALCAVRGARCAVPHHSLLAVPPMGDGWGLSRQDNTIRIDPFEP